MSVTSADVLASADVEKSRYIGIGKNRHQSITYLVIKFLACERLFGKTKGDFTRNFFPAKLSSLLVLLY